MRSSVLFGRPAPRDGDVLVAREPASAAPYAIAQVPGLVQVSTTGRDEAIRLALSFAARQAVDVWYREDGTDYLLATYRSPAASRHRARHAARAQSGPA